MNLTDKQLERIAKEANKAIHKKFPMLRNEAKETTIPYIIEAYEKVCSSGKTTK